MEPVRKIKKSRSRDIEKMRSYKMGFSDALNTTTAGARKDILRWGLQDDVAKKRYFRGYKQGWSAKCEVLKDRQIIK